MLHQVDVFGGMGDDALVLINTAKTFQELRLEDLVERHNAEKLHTVPATELAREHVGRPLPNAAMLGSFAALTGQVAMDSVAKAIRSKFKGKVGDGNVAAAQAAYDAVGGAQALEETAHA